MNIVEKNGKKKVVMSKSEWMAIGKVANWNEPTSIEDLITDKYGKHIGLNADWSVQAWKLQDLGNISGKNLFLIDNEDGTWSFVERKESSDGDNDEIKVIKNLSKNQLLKFLNVDFKGCEECMFGFIQNDGSCHECGARN